MAGRMGCPKCTAGMRELRAAEGRPHSVAAGAGLQGEVVLDRCDRCGCTWFDGLELAKVFAFHPATVQVVGKGPVRHSPLCPRCGNEAPARGDNCPVCNASAYLACPRCGTTLQAGEVGKVAVESCPQCLGILLDAGEAKRIAQGFGITPPGGWTCADCGEAGLQEHQANDVGAGRFLCHVCFRRRNPLATPPEPRPALSEAALAMKFVLDVAEDVTEPHHRRAGWLGHLEHEKTHRDRERRADEEWKKRQGQG